MKYLSHTLLIAAGSIIGTALGSAPSGHTVEPVKSKLTFARDVAPILYSKCASCHHEGEVAPFSLMSYDDARAKSLTIAAVVQQKFMPPWHAVSHGEFTNDRSLTAGQIATLTDWAKAGAPAGDLSKAPIPPTFSSNWHIGQPDFSAKLPKPYAVGAEGPDEFRCFVVPTDFDKDRFVSEVELKPGNRKIVHHIVIYVSTTGEARKLDGKDGKPGYASFGGAGVPVTGILGVWAPGLQPISAPQGTGIMLPKGADIILQVHYHRDGKAEEDQSEIGLKFSSRPVDKKICTTLFGTSLISIPKESTQAETAADMYLSTPITIYDVFPHMHMLGHDMQMMATLPNGSKQELFKVNNYDFNWQTRYIYRNPVHLPTGTHLELIAHYDNSTGNVRNPSNPPKTVWFGEQTTDEMCFAICNFSVDDEHLLANKGHLGGIAVPGKSQTLERVFDRFDTTHSGFLDVAQFADVVNEYQLGKGRSPGRYNPKAISAYFIGLVGKTQKGKISKAEFISQLLITEFGN